ncbi:MAG: DUF2855 family protein [Parvularculaceae bacterium]|nr:DUF2855 family protein [Parvularculaceae bacterium]
MAEATELWVRHDDLAQADIHTKTLAALDDGEALLEVESFGVTANNVTYGVVGHQIGYWKFFPTAEEGTGIIPVWGFGKVVESRSEDVAVGDRLYGYFPMGTHMVMRPQRKGGTVMDRSAHRAELPPAYNAYRLTSEEPALLAEREDARSVLFPLFATSFIIADWLQDNAFFGAEQVLVTSASSKTSFGTGAMIGRLPGAPSRIGMTSERNRAFTESLGVFDSVITYDEVETLADKPTALVDMSGNSEVISKVHNHLGDNVKNSAIVGVTHWEAPRQQAPLPGAKPTMFFAPGQIQKRDQELGAGVLMGQALTAWAEVTDNLGDLFSFEHHHGVEATRAAWQATVAGQVSPTVGIVASLTKGA